MEPKESDSPRETLQHIIGPQALKLVKNPLFTTLMVLGAGAERVTRNRINKRLHQAKSAAEMARQMAESLMPQMPEIPEEMADELDNLPDEPVKKVRKKKKKSAAKPNSGRKKKV